MSYNQAIHDGDYTKPVPVGPKRWQRPFNDDPNFYLYDQDFEQQEKFFRPAIDYPKEIASSIGEVGKVPAIDNFVHRCVEEGALQPIGGGVVRWTRTYARTPLPRLVWESYNWKVPGIATVAEQNSRTIDKNSSSQGGTVTTIVTTTAHGAAVGDFVQVSYYANIGGVGYGRTVLREVLTVGPGGAASTSFTIAKILDTIYQPEGQPPQWLNTNVGITRVPILRTVSSKVQMEYFAVGEKAIKSPEDIPIIERENVLTVNGEQTDTYATDSLPTAAEYMATFGTWIVAEDSIIRLWRGHIYERSTRYVRAK